MRLAWGLSCTSGKVRLLRSGTSAVRCKGMLAQGCLHTMCLRAGHAAQNQGLRGTLPPGDGRRNAEWEAGVGKRPATTRHDPPRPGAILFFCVCTWSLWECQTDQSDRTNRGQESETRFASAFRRRSQRAPHAGRTSRSELRRTGAPAALEFGLDGLASQALQVSCPQETFASRKAISPYQLLDGWRRNWRGGHSFPRRAFASKKANLYLRGIGRLAMGLARLGGGFMIQSLPTAWLVHRMAVKN
ncbi:MAG: hypothetical protein JWR26_1800 [Pedosphaera sp.]|nr:hypothetical protein [Pedosphaera sp.]